MVDEDSPLQMYDRVNMLVYGDRWDPEIEQIIADFRNDIEAVSDETRQYEIVAAYMSSTIRLCTNDEAILSRVENLSRQLKSPYN